MSGLHVNPETIGDPDKTPILQHSVSGCPAHCEDWLYAAVRTNRRLAGLSPQDCACDEADQTTEARIEAAARARFDHAAKTDGAWELLSEPQRAFHLAGMRAAIAAMEAVR